MSDQKNQGGIGGKSGKAQDVVSKDRNWVLLINSELESEKKWASQWGYLSRNLDPQKTESKLSTDQKIQQLEQEVAEMDGDLYDKSSNSYGKGAKVELFNNTENNMQKNKDLRPLERRLPKGWKKQKWTPPVDPFDPLSKQGKKK